ncbi:collagen alpha-2(I) chain-like [Peromyscus californicus insignis]|uniref:collagen alpha-2(I) chain-like n=1 Tax=Peromyscus californicus insignis TaxID=564181 RepID=UPI0022A68CD7|nr:collagen alpha-2(I) chain-like [Peromyscus californicus insignis]
MSPGALNLPSGWEKRRALLRLASPGSPGRPALTPAPQQPHKLTCGSAGGGCGERCEPRSGECAPLGRAGRRWHCAPAAARADCAQPDAAGLCPRRHRRRRGRRALADMLSFRTCPRGSYQEPAAAGEAARAELQSGGRELEATTPAAPGRGGRCAAKNSSCGRKPPAAGAPPRRASPPPPPPPPRALGLRELASDCARRTDNLPV